MRVCSAVVIVLIGLLVSGCALKTPSGKDDTATKHQLGDHMDVRYYPLGGKLMQKIAHHTYPEAFDARGVRYAWKALGGDTGGDVLAETTTQCGQTQGCIDISTVNYIMSEPPCIWPHEHYYAIVGVCWNATNRGLYYTGKTVHNVPFYALIEKIYGTYGLDTNSACWYSLNPSLCKEGKKKYAWSSCLAQVEKEMPWSARKAAVLEAHSTNPRIQLYHDYAQQAANDALGASLEERYLTQLFELNIQEKLGAIPEEQKATLLSIDQTYKAKRAQGENALFGHEEHLDALNQLLNEELQAYQEVLSDEAYFNLFGAPKSMRFEIRNY